MSDEYDGWAVKDLRHKISYLYSDSFSEKRTDVVKKFDKSGGKRKWREYQRKGWLKIVKANLVEVK